MSERSREGDARGQACAFDAYVGAARSLREEIEKHIPARVCEDVRANDFQSLPAHFQIVASLRSCFYVAERRVTRSGRLAV